MRPPGQDHRQAPPRHRGRAPVRRRGGFTLIELLVSIVIFVLLTALVLAAFQRDDSDRLNASARMLQSYLEGARSRAISDDRPRGVRLIARTNDPGVVDRIAYIGSPGFDGDDASTVTLSQVAVPSLGGTQFWHVQSPSNKWSQRLGPKTVANPTGRNLIRPGLRIEVPRDSRNWFTVSAVDFDTQVTANGFYVEGNYSGPIATPVEYRLELAPTILPNTEPVPLDNGIVIDLDASQIPDRWWSNPDYMDFLFDRRGSPTGPLVASGLIHLYVTTISDVEMTRAQDPNHPGNGLTSRPPSMRYVPARAPIVPKTEPYVITLFTQAGQVTTGQVNPANTDGDAWADDPYSYARRGREAQ